jgi:hypothetical protein
MRSLLLVLTLTACGPGTSTAIDAGPADARAIDAAAVDAGPDATVVTPDAFVACGMDGEACCPGDTCDPELGCYPLESGAKHCAHCGAATGQPCCAVGTECGPSYVCVISPPGNPDDFTMACDACGAVGHPCCTTGCDPGSTCNAMNVCE